jgi:hypothetical protein
MSKVYSEHESIDSSWCATPTSLLLRNLHARGETARWIAAITTSAGEVIRIALGDPVGDNFSSWLYLPPWFCMHAGIIGDGSDDRVEVRFEKCEDLPKATQITVETLGEIPDGLDIRELLEEPLSQLGVLQEGMILPIPCVDAAHLRVKQTKPAACVFLDGHDVTLCFEEKIPTQVKSRTPTPMPTPFFTAADATASMLPALSLGAQPTGSFRGIGRRLNEV